MSIRDELFFHLRKVFFYLNEAVRLPNNFTARCKGPYMGGSIYDCRGCQRLA